MSNQFIRTYRGGPLLDEIQQTGRLIVTNTGFPADGQKYQTYMDSTTNEIYEHDGNDWVLKSNLNDAVTIETLDDIDDVQVPAAVLNDTLRYDGVSTWINESPSILAKATTELGDLKGVDLSVPPTTGEILKYDGVNWKADTDTSGPITSVNGDTGPSVSLGINDMTDFAGAPPSVGDMIVSVNPGQWSNLVVGTDGQVLTSDSGATNWMDPASLQLDDLTNVDTSTSLKGSLICKSSDFGNWVNLGKGTNNQALSSFGTDISWRDNVESVVNLVPAGPSYKPLKQIIGGVAQLRPLQSPDGSITMAEMSDRIDISVTAPSTTGSNVGSGSQVFKGKVLEDLEFRSIKAGLVQGLSVTQPGDEVSIGIDAGNFTQLLSPTTADNIILEDIGAGIKKATVQTIIDLVPLVPHSLSEHTDTAGLSSSGAIGDMAYRDTATTWKRVLAGNAGDFLKLTSAPKTPFWEAPMAMGEAWSETSKNITGSGTTRTEITNLTTLGANNMGSFDSPAAGRLRYTGGPTYKFHCGLTISGKTSAGANQELEFDLAKNGVKIPGSRIKMTGDNNDFHSSAIHVFASLAQNDYLSAFVVNNTASNDFIVDSFNLFCMTVG